MCLESLVMEFKSLTQENLVLSLKELQKQIKIFICASLRNLTESKHIISTKFLSLSSLVY